MESGGKKKRNGATTSLSIPPAAREMVSNLKEIVSCSEQDIYATLKDCDMDPDQAVQRLLYLDTFHEVKSKREKKKEPKGTAESRSQRVSSISGCGLVGGADRGGRSTVQNGYNDNGFPRGKPEIKKENETSVAPTSSNFGYAATNSNCSITLLSDHDSKRSTVHAPRQFDLSSPSQPSSIYEHNWSGLPGQLSLADIVKMGRPQRKPSNIPATTAPTKSCPGLHSSQFPVLKSMEVSRVLSTVANQNKSLEQCSAVDRPSEGFGTIVSDTSGSDSSAIYLDLPASSTLHAGGTGLDLIPHVDDTGSLRGAIDGENLQTELRISDEQLQVENSDCISGLDHGSFEDTYSHNSQNHTSEQLEAKDLDEVLSSAVTNFQHLNFVQEEQGATPAEENPAVVIPHHLQVTNADCAHLSFGTFGSAGASFSVVTTSNLLENNEAPVVVSENVSPTYQSGDRKPEYYNKDHLGCGLDNILALGRVTSSRNDDMASVSKPEVIRENTYQSGDRSPYDKNDHLWNALDNNVAPERVTSSRNDDMSSVSKPEVTRDETFDTVHRLHHEMSFIPRIFPASDVEASSEVQNISPITNLLALNPGLFSTLRPPPPIVSSTAIATGPAFPQNLRGHPYSQPSQSRGPFPNLISYPVLPQSIPSMQFSGRTAFHQSPAALQSAGMQYSFPQYKYDSLNGLPVSLPAALGYGGLGVSANIPGSLSQNPSTVASGRTADGYEVVLRSQFREGDHFSLLNQSGNSLRLHGARSRTVPAIPGDMYNAFQVQEDQQGRNLLWQVQQQHAQMRMVGYPNSYQPQAWGFSREHQQPSSLADLIDFRSQPTQQSNQYWRPHNF